MAGACGLDVLINNAGVLHSYALEGTDAEAKSEEEVQVNLLGSLRMTRLALPLLRRSEEAAVVLVSSAMALVPAPRLLVYSATKAGVHSLARSLRHELVADSIKVFEVIPPMVDTGLVYQLQVAKIAPQAVADALAHGLARDRYEIRIGEVRSLALVSRLAPRVADVLMALATRPPAARSTRPSNRPRPDRRSPL